MKTHQPSGKEGGDSEGPSWFAGKGELAMIDEVELSSLQFQCAVLIKTSYHFECETEIRVVSTAKKVSGYQIKTLRTAMNLDVSWTVVA